MDHPTYTWSLSARLAYRFVSSYFAIFLFLPTILVRPVELVVASWLGVSPALMNAGLSGSGDRTVDWIHALTALTLAIVVTVVWSLLDRKRREYMTALAWTRLALRYQLAWVIIGYGVVKVFPTQFQPPTYERLMTPFGDFSPMGLLWSFMGASMGYTIFAGATEVLAALLLLFRRTALLGALLTFVVMTNVFALNMSYDVPVKLYSFHWLVMALVIAAPDLGRLFRFAVLQQPADPPVPAGPVFATRRWRTVSWAAKAIVLAVLIIQARGAYTRYGANVEQRPLAGAYRVEGFSGWQEVVLENARAMRVTRDNGTITRYRLWQRDNQSGLELRDSVGRPSGSLTVRVGGGGMMLEGDVHGTPARLHLVESENFLLLGRGFHWINEVPFNR